MKKTSRKEIVNIFSSKNIKKKASCQKRIKTAHCLFISHAQRLNGNEPIEGKSNLLESTFLVKLKQTFQADSTAATS